MFYSMIDAYISYCKLVLGNDLKTGNHKTCPIDT